MLTGPVVSGANVFEESSDRRHPLGALFVDNFGRAFRYARAGASALVAGELQQAPAQIANHQDLTPTAAAIGDRTLTVTLGATAVTVDQYAGGSAIVSVTPGLGLSYPISGHPAANASASLTLSLARGWEIKVALTTTSRVILSPNKYRGVIQMPTTVTNAPAGVAPMAITAAFYFWLCTHGLIGTLVEGTPAIGTPVGPSNATAGAVGVCDGTDAALPMFMVGQMMDTGQNGVVQPVYLTLE